MLSVPPGLRRQNSADAAPHESPLERRLWAWVVTLQAFAGYLAGAARRAAAEAARANARSARLKRELSACQRDRDDLRSAAAGLAADVAAARADLAAERDAHASSAAAAAEREAQLRSESALEKTSIAAGLDRERRLQAKLDEQTAHAASAAREAEAEAAKAAVSQAQLREQLQTSQRVNIELRSAVAQVSGDVTAVKTQLATAQDARSNDAAVAAERETQLRHQLSAYKKTDVELRIAVAKTSADVTARQTELVVAQDARNSEAAAAVERETQLHDQLSACQRDNAELRSAVAKVTADVTVVRTELAAARDGRTPQMRPRPLSGRLSCRRLWQPRRSASRRESGAMLSCAGTWRPRGRQLRRCTSSWESEKRRSRCLWRT